MVCPLLSFSLFVRGREGGEDWTLGIGIYLSIIEPSCHAVLCHVQFPRFPQP